MHLFDIMTFGYKVGVDPSITDFFEAMRSASAATTTDLAARLRYRNFDRYTLRKDYFYIPRMFGVSAALFAELALSRGFVDTATLTARYATTPLKLRNGDASQYENLRDLQGDNASDHIMVNSDAGTVSVFDVDLTDYWVEITYTGGLYAASDENYENVPDWLVEASMAQASIFLLQNRALTPENGPETGPINTQIAHALNSHGRFFPHMLKPTMTTPDR